MGRNVRDSSLETRSARSRLKTAHKPYFRLIEPGLHLGYRKLATGPGSWVARRYTGKGKYTVRNLTNAEGEMILADDFAEADGQRVLTFAEAQKMARGARSFGPYTVRSALDAYFRLKEDEGRNVKDARKRAEALIYEALGDIQCDRLSANKLRGWLSAMVKAAPRKRTKRGQPQAARFAGTDEVTKRRRRASANRVFTILRAALNHAFNDGKIASDKEWRRVKAFSDVDEARPGYLTLAEATRLMNACNPDFRQMVQAALLTGARYGQLCRLTVGDFNPDAATVQLRSQKGRTGTLKTYHATLDDEGLWLFQRLCARRPSTSLMLIKNGTAWNQSEQIRRMKDACKIANIVPPIGFHGLRHTWASHAVMNGIPLLVVAQNLGHSDTRMVERHYGHLAPSYKRDVIRANAPKFGIVSNDNVADLKAG